MSGEMYYPEIMSPGVGVFDYDNDGDLDVYVVQGQMLGAHKTLKDAVYSPHGALRDRRYRHELTPGQPATLRFRDVHESSVINVPTYGMGVAVGDIDNDGYVVICRTGLSGA